MFFLPKTSLLIPLLLICSSAYSADCRFIWTTPTTYANSSRPLAPDELTGYNFKISSSGGSFPDALNSTNDPLSTAFIQTDLPDLDSGFYSFAIKAINKKGELSDPGKFNFTVRGGVCAEYVEAPLSTIISAPTVVTVETL